MGQNSKNIVWIYREVVKKKLTLTSSGEYHEESNNSDSGVVSFSVSLARSIDPPTTPAGNNLRI